MEILSSVGPDGPLMRIKIAGYATTPSPVQTLQEEVVCAISLDYFTDPPKSIGCFCRGCVTQLWGKEDEEDGRRKETLKLFCEVDEEAICVVCRESRSHKQHSVVPLEEVVQEYKANSQGSACTAHLQTQMHRVAGLAESRAVSRDVLEWEALQIRAPSDSRGGRQAASQVAIFHCFPVQGHFFQSMSGRPDPQAFL
ncbi:E3 ubiquitin-protein ligase TRIM41-like [Rhinolophus sinicus]|uniref:E3 ubiquitin-protein ligase TRIM41-like n=1 Tax=Rhinolophus sinicus TaxID=89399 RepID=UPI003D7A5099